MYRVVGTGLPAGANEPPGTVGYAVLVECGTFAEAAVEGAGGPGCLGGVLGDTGSDLLMRAVVVVEGRDGPDVQCRAPAQRTCGLPFDCVHVTVALRRYRCRLSRRSEC